MTGLELSRAYYETHGKPMLEADFKELLPLLAVGFVGAGSERLGFDDEVSRDHDFEPGFAIFLPDETLVDRRAAFRLERAYAKLPKTFEGFSRAALSPVGGNRNGVLRTADFYTAAVGSPDGALSLEAWLSLPDYALAEATDGEVFFDGLGEFSAIRERLAVYPEDIRLKRLAGQLLLAAQAGQYNYPRCHRHGEHEAAALAAGRFVEAALAAYFLLKNRYRPYYKWSFRALRQLEGGAAFAEKLAVILSGGDAEAVYDAIEDAAAALIAELITADITDAVCGDLEKHAYSVNDRITDAALRNRHILAAV